MSEEQTKGDKTERVVLRRMRGVADGEVIGEHWVERGRAVGSKREAIKAVVGDEQGVFRAPSLRSWKGAIEQGEPVVRQRTLDD